MSKVNFDDRVVYAPYSESVETISETEVDNIGEIDNVDMELSTKYDVEADEKKPKADVLDLLLAKDLSEFKTESTRVEISRLSDILGEKFIVELRVLPPAVGEAIDKDSFKFDYDEDGGLDLDIRYEEQKVKTLIEATYTLDGKQLFKQQSLRRKFGVRTNDDLVKKLLLSGEVDKLYKKYQKLAGYVKTSVVDIKN